MKISLRKSIESDLIVFYHNEADPKAKFMTAFTLKVPETEMAFIEKWSRIMKKDSVHMQSILIDHKLIGYVMKFEAKDETDIMYAIDKEYWGKGITSMAVKLFLEIEVARPIFGWVANDNIGSQKVLEKSGFKKVGSQMEFANARGIEIEEYIYRLDV